MTFSLLTQGCEESDALDSFTGAFIKPMHTDWSVALDAALSLTDYDDDALRLHSSQSLSTYTVIQAIPRWGQLNPQGYTAVP